MQHRMKCKREHKINYIKNIELRLVTDRQTDRQTQGRNTYRTSIESRGNDRML